MKLAAKLILFLVLVIFIMLVIDGYISYQRQSKLFEKGMKLDAHLIGNTMKRVVADIWRRDGERSALKIIKDASNEEHPMTIRWVWLDASPENLHSPRVPVKKLAPVVHGQTISLKGRGKNGKGCLYSYIPVTVDGKRPGAIELSEPLSQLEEYTRTAFIRILALTGVLVFLSAFAVPLLGVRMLGRPLKILVEKIRRVGTGDFSGPLHLPGHDELSELALGLNTTCEQLQEAWEKIRIETESRIAALEQLRHEDRLRTVGRLASGIAHELGTPLNVISGRAGLISRDHLSTGETKESASIIKTQSERITTIIRQLLDFARKGTTNRTSVDLRQMVRRTLNLMSPLGHKQKVDICLTGRDSPTMVNVDVEQIQQVLMNILTNSLHAMPQGGKVEVGIRCEHARPPEGHEAPEGKYICLHVQDGGQGISEENMNHIFEPFFTTKDTGRGTGLGLSIAYGIVREHGGWIDVKSELGKGSCFSVYLPQEDN